MSNEKIKYHYINFETRIKSEEKEDNIYLIEEKLTPVMCKSDPNMEAFSEWRETNKVKIDKNLFLKMFQSIDFNLK